MKTDKTTKENINKLMLKHEWLTPLDLQNLLRLMYDTLIIFPIKDKSVSKLSIGEIVGIHIGNLALQSEEELKDLLRHEEEHRETRSGLAKIIMGKKGGK